MSEQLALVSEAQRSDSVRSMEMTTLQAAFVYDVGSDRHLNLSVRLGELEKDAPATFDSKCGEGMAHMMNGFFATGMAVHKEKPDRTQVQPPSVQQAKEGFDLCVVQRVRSQLDAKLLTQDPIKKRFMTLHGFHPTSLLCWCWLGLKAWTEISGPFHYEKGGYYINNKNALFMKRGLLLTKKKAPVRNAPERST